VRLEPENENTEDAIFEGVLSGDEEGNYWVSQENTYAKIDTEGLNEKVLENSKGEAISVIGILSLQQKGDSTILSYEVKPKIIAPLEGYNPQNNTYITRVGDDLLEAYRNSVQEFQGKVNDLEDIDKISF